MTLPKHLEGLDQISIDTLDLSESTQAILKWHGLTHVLDCIAFFYTRAQENERFVQRAVTRLFRLMFGEVKPALIAAGYWDLVMDAEVWCALAELEYETPPRRIVHWKGQDQDLNDIPFEQLGLSDMPAGVSQYFKSVRECIHYFIMHLIREPGFRAEIDNYKGADRPADETLHFDGYLCRVVQPRLAELGCWALIEAHVDTREELG